LTVLVQVIVNDVVARFFDTQCSILIHCESKKHTQHYFCGIFYKS